MSASGTERVGVTGPLAPNPSGHTVLDAAVRSRGMAALARPSGAFAMLALDQRGSLETLFRRAGRSADARSIRGFRMTAARLLAPHASAILLEREFLGGLDHLPAWPPSCSLIVAADLLVQPEDAPVESTLLDPYAASLAVRLRAPALKLLVMWRPGRRHEGEVALVRDFVELAHGHGLLAVTEGIVTGPRGAHGAAPDDGLLAAARTLSVGADIYKAQVPIDAGESPAQVEALSRELSALVPCPWVVLSNGVLPERFPELARAACAGGASGFLAGRAIWAGAITAPDMGSHLAEQSARQLRALVEMVDAVARPWQEALGATPPGPTGCCRPDP